ncbi:G1 S-specific cyclin-D3 isoform X1 [Brachionus plicatilis]|uniref:G1 S-specific cyclin-D3 isoform X1 n=1 Tax=Brachionus plicatilis TaxID=10195 RepID=A0A3M7QBM1_BRAPC|nr:G1 S-specific cyclin-D3 isoform X1 [Brachionus plicatilis]
MLNDTLESMLKLEDFYLISSNYLNESIDNETRSTLAVWMLEVCEQEDCTHEIFNPAMNLFDRFMLSAKHSQLDITKPYLQLIGCTCLFVASKLRSHKPLAPLKLIDYTDNSISLIDLLELEILILQKLRYDSDSICANDYLSIYLSKLDIEHVTGVDDVKRHFYAFTALCSTEIQFSFYPSSMLAFACLMCALNGLRNSIELECGKLGSKLVNVLSNYTHIDVDCLELLTESVNLLLGKSAPCALSSEPICCNVNVKVGNKRSSTCSSVSSTSSLMELEYTNISSYCLTPPQANQLPQ